jgi:hypothetical protein
VVSLPRLVERLAAYCALEAKANRDSFLHQWRRPLAIQGRLDLRVRAALARTRAGGPPSLCARRQRPNFLVSGRVISFVILRPE